MYVGNFTRGTIILISTLAIIIFSRLILNVFEFIPPLYSIFGRFLIQEDSLAKEDIILYREIYHAWIVIGATLVFQNFVLGVEKGFKMFASIVTVSIF